MGSGTGLALIGSLLEKNSVAENRNVIGSSNESGAYVFDTLRRPTCFFRLAMIEPPFGAAQQYNGPSRSWPAKHELSTDRSLSGFCEDMGSISSDFFICRTFRIKNDAHQKERYCSDKRDRCLRT